MKYCIKVNCSNNAVQQRTTPDAKQLQSDQNTNLQIVTGWPQILP